VSGVLPKRKKEKNTYKRYTHTKEFIIITIIIIIIIK